MRALNNVSPPSSSHSISSGIKIWKSPIPYLFGGLALMLVLISVALVILVCSYRKRASQSSSSPSPNSEEDMKQAMPKIIEINSEPEVLVIMAGHHQPTFLAKPISSSSIYCTCGAQQQPTPSSPSSSSTSTTHQSLTN